MQSTLARESHDLQHAQRQADERLVIEREQALARTGETRLEGERTRPLETALDGVLEGPLAERLARCETLSPLTTQSEPYGFFSFTY